MGDRLRAFRTLRYMDRRTVLVLRQDVFEDHLASEADVHALLSLGRDVPVGDREWSLFFCEAITDWAMRQDEPHGRISAEAASRLAVMLDDGRPAAGIELDLVAHLIQHVRTVPPRLMLRAALAVREAALAEGIACETDEEVVEQLCLLVAGRDKAAPLPVLAVAG